MRRRFRCRHWNSMACLWVLALTTVLIQGQFHGILAVEEGGGGVQAAADFPKRRLSGQAREEALAVTEGAMANTRRIRMDEAGAEARRMPSRYLDGSIVQVGESWSCTGVCGRSLQSSDSTERPAYADRIIHPQCIESWSTGSLQVTTEIDAQCAGVDHTCEDLEQEPLRSWRYDMYHNCDQDPELIAGVCFYVCRYGQHFAQRCVHQIDMNNQYRLHPINDGLDYHSCVVLWKCEGALEINSMWCNHTSLSSSSSESSNTGLIVGLGVALGVACLCLIPLLGLLVLILRRRKAATLANVEAGEGGTVVVGRPMANGAMAGDATPGVVAGARPKEVGNDATKASP